MADRSAEPFVMFVGDRAPSVEWTLVDAKGDPVETTGWTFSSLTLEETDRRTVVVGNGALTFNANRKSGVVTWAWGTAETATAGEYTLYLRLLDADSRPFTLEWERMLIVKRRPAA